MNFGAIYFNHGTAHCARLVVSLHSLRKHYGGPVTILDTGNSGGIVEKITADKRLDVDAKRIEFVQRRRNSAYCMKASLWRHSPYNATLFLDADTAIARPLDKLIEIICGKMLAPFVVTRFADWLTTGPIIRKRIERWAGVKVGANSGGFEKSIDCGELVRDCFDAPHPAINTGVVAWRDEAKSILRAWERITHAGWRNPFTDELAAQLLIRRYPHVLVGSEWNSSPIYYKGSDPAAIWHGHGDKHLARADGRGAQGHAIWEPLFQEVFAENVGGIKGWAPAGDEVLARHLPFA